MDRWLQQLLYTLFPGTCVLCDAASHRNLDLCEGCEGDLPRLTDVCLRCSIPLLPAQTLCGRCFGDPPPFERSVALYRYVPPIDQLIIDFKYNRKLLIGKVLGYLLARKLDDLYVDSAPDLLIPVPLHPKRLRDRGFNQALEIADVISDCCRIPIDNRCCRRVKHTDAQRNLSAKQRQRNISNAFRVDREIAARKVAIVDDVVTTGATVTELSKTLLRNGVEEVHVWAVARTTAPTAIHAG
ncbi:MAG: ComF family protein [Pseudomonadales bacterium]|jgi:ComF family protein|nr:ComF family protein [Pseudomonadales bacterium]MDP7595303.1 ComF family protein [Pseudomonadales bacterium]HJN53273.1 ComF family protein [Pseudomonadales bacterium]|tara:strand:- start:24612 stop:25334 length:723 start_codon:yes stop_codon:yes gene_type:complete